jgi:hypothetical protein
MNKKTLGYIFVALAAALVLIPSLLTAMAGIVFSETVSRILLTVGILLIMAFVLIDIRDVSKTKAKGKLAACVGLLYVLVMQWLG